MREVDKPASVWLLQDGEPLPTDDHPRLMRTGDQARRLVEMGYAVIWWTSRFNHALKRFRGHQNAWVTLNGRYRIVMLDGPGYDSNVSWRRIRHYRAIARHFSRLAENLPPPSLILGSYPSPELCDAGRRYARRHGVPFVIDIRDPWPDIFPEYFPAGLRWVLFPILWHYRRKIRAVSNHADGIVAVSKAMLNWGIRYSGRGQTERDRVFHIGYRRHPNDRPIRVPSKFTSQEPLVCLFATTGGNSYDGHMLVDAIRILELKGEDRVRFIISGEGDSSPSWVARATGLTTVTFTGWISHDELQSLFYTAHLGIVLLKGGIVRFWLGNKIFEYLASSLGVVNNVPGEPEEIVASHDLGVNIPQADPGRLALVLASLADHPERVEHYMTNARRAFIHAYDREAVGNEYAGYLESIIRRRAAQPKEAHA